MAKNFITILSLLVTMIVSITAYAYRTDLNNIKENVVENENAIKASKSECIEYVDEQMTDHEKLHLQQEKNNSMLIKYLDQRFDDMEKLIKK